MTHAHGPVQAWARITEAEHSGAVDRQEILASITEAIRARLTELARQDVDAQDPRVIKEELTLKFVEKLLR